MISKKEEKETIILSKIDALEKAILSFLNVKLDIKLTGNEIKIDLNNKNINNMTLKLLSSIEFKNLEEFDLSHNNISDANLLTEFIFNKLKKLNLSFNKLSPLTFKNQVSESIFSKNSIDINLDNNNLIKKDIEMIKNLLLSSEANIGKAIHDTYSRDSLIGNNKTKKDKKKKKIIYDKLNMLEKKILDYFSVKFNFVLTGNELKLDLNNKNIEDIEFNLLSSIEFKNLEEINLSHNNITDIKPLLNFKALKKVDLSFNKINDILPLEELIENNINISKINLSNNNINKVNISKKISQTRNIEINLDNNNVILKDIEDIKHLLKNNTIINNKVDESLSKETNQKLILISRKKYINHNLRYQMFNSMEQIGDEILMIKNKEEGINNLRNEEKNQLLIPINYNYSFKMNSNIHD